MSVKHACVHLSAGAADLPPPASPAPGPWARLPSWTVGRGGLV